MVKKRKNVRRMHLHWFLYLLELEDKHYYVGISTDPVRRFKQHNSGQGARFTGRFKPVKMLTYKYIGKCTQREAERYEDALSLEMIQTLGNVRVKGGHFFRYKTKEETYARNYKKTPEKYRRFIMFEKFL
jgi:excinuclease ABC C subunit domain protein